MENHVYMSDRRCTHRMDSEQASEPTGPCLDPDASIDMDTQQFQVGSCLQLGLFMLLLEEIFRVADKTDDSNFALSIPQT